MSPGSGLKPVPETPPLVGTAARLETVVRAPIKETWGDADERIVLVKISGVRDGARTRIEFLGVTKAYSAGDIRGSAVVDSSGEPRPQNYTAALSVTRGEEPASAAFRNEMQLWAERNGITVLS